MRRLAVGAFALVVLSGCAGRQRVSPVAAPALGSLPAATALIQSLDERRLALRSVRAYARLRYTSPELSRHAKQIILAARPDRLRFEVLSPLGAVFVLTASHGRLAAYARNESTVYRGAASPANLERYTTIDLPLSSAIDLLLGTPPLGPDGPLVVSRDGIDVQLRQDGGTSARVLWFDAQLDPIRYEQHDANGRVLLRAEFGTYIDAGGVRLPTRLSLQTPAAQRRVDIELREPEVNPALAEALFALDTPRGSREVDLDQVVN